MKVSLQGRNLLYPMPVTIIGAMVAGRPNFINIAHVGILNAAKPHLISLGMNKGHYTNAGIRAHKALSINILSRKHVAEADWVGLVSGRDTDKSTAFTIEYGALQVPMIAEAPLCMECRLRDVYDAGTHEVFIVEVIDSWADEAVLSAGKPDLAKVDPILFDMSGPSYYAIGERIGDPWKSGKAFRP